MALSAQEMILALRAPNAHWLAALVNALDEALADPEFGAQQRKMVAQLLTVGIVPGSVARAAESRFAQFEQSFDEMRQASLESESFPSGPNRPVGARPKLTLVGGNAAA
ncbi:MAG: hypothetical protein ABI411_20620 [Tahibacter sp.]